MLLGTILGWIVAGLIVGGLARLLLPGRQNMSIPLTIVLGIVGAVVGGFIGSLVFGPNLVTDSTETYAVQTAWPGWIMAIVGGTLVLWVYLGCNGQYHDSAPTLTFPDHRRTEWSGLSLPSRPVLTDTQQTP